MSLVGGDLNRQPLLPFLDTGEVNAAINPLSEYLVDARIPCVVADHYEYWLMDASDQTPNIRYVSHDSVEADNNPNTIGSADWIEAYKLS